MKGPATFTVVSATVLAVAVLAGAGVTGAGCRSRVARHAASPAPATAAAPSAEPIASAADKAEPAEAPPRPLRRCFAEQPSWVDAPVGTLLDRAADLYEGSDFSGALACAEEAARQAPRSVEAHHNRAIALVRLDRMDEARDALALALALGPDDPETLEAAADLHINQLPPTADRSALGLEYARRGSRRATRRDPERVARLALLEGQALIDLGRASEALRRIDAALTASPGFAAASYERGVALFELCRFAEARRMFERVLVETPNHAHALYHLGLIEERFGEDGAGRHLAAASEADAKSFPAPIDVSAGEFAARVQHAVAELPEDVRRDLAGIRIETADLPDDADLTAEKPPLSPTILGLYRGLPLDFGERTAVATPAGRPGKGRAVAPQPAGGGAGGLRTPMAASAPQCDPGSRAIVLYRRNLLRTVRDGVELDAAITRTLMHEVGHLRGEDDGSLRDRGLE
jgi:tetratricopeptide (TPR) repeat protein